MPDSLGATLKKIRESKSLSIKEVSEKTRISKSALLSLEANDLSQFSSLFYARSFVRTYAAFLKAQDEPAIKDFLTNAPKKDIPALEIKPKVSIENKASFSWIIKHKRHVIAGTLTVIGIWVIFLGMLGMRKFARDFMIKHKERARISQTLPKKQVKKITPVKKNISPKTQKVKQENIVYPQAKEPARPKEPEKIQEAVAEAAFTLEILARYNVWLEVVSDNVLVFRGTFEKDKKDVWKANKEIKLKIGNAGAVLMKLDGKSLGSPGEKGEKKVLVVTKDGIKKQ